MSRAHPEQVDSALRRQFVIGLSVLIATGIVRAAQREKIARIAFLGVTTPQGYARQLDALLTGLREYGYVEGKNIVIESRWAEGDYERLPKLAVELVRLQPDVLVTHSQPGTRAAKEATATIPIVMALAGEAVATGLVASLARPGGNVTGSTFFLPELSAKRLELLRDAFAHLRRIAILRYPDRGANLSLRETQMAAKALKLTLQTYEARNVAELENAFAAMGRAQAEAVAVIDSPALIAAAERIAQLAAQARLPSIGFTELASAGGLMGYGVDFPAMYRRAAHFVDKILKGTKPADIPIERATRFELVVNLKTAKALGITMPAIIMVRADRVID